MKRRTKITSTLTKRVGSIALSLALVSSGLQFSNTTVMAVETGTWKGDVTAAMDTLDEAMNAADDYAGALQNLKDAMEGLELAISVEDLKVAAVGEDFILLQWLPTDIEGLVGYNVYWADKDLETTKFQLIGPDGDLAERMSGDLDENGKKVPAPTMTIAAEDVADRDVIEFKVNLSTFKNNYFKVAVVTAEGVGTQTAAVESPTAVEYEAILDELGRGLVATQKADGVHLNWRLTWDELDGGYFEDESGQGLTGLNFNVYRNGEKIATVTNSTNYLDTEVTSGLTQDMYYLIPVDADGNELTEEKAEIYQVLTADSAYADVAYLQFDTYVPEPQTLGEIYGEIEEFVNSPNDTTYNKDTVITYDMNDASLVDVDGDGEYELLVKWAPSLFMDVSYWGYTGNQLIDCYKIDGTLLWRLDLGINIRAGEHYTQPLAFDFEGDGQGELVLKTAPGTKMIQYEIGEDGKNVMVDTDEDGVADYPKVKAENYITIPGANVTDVAEGIVVTDLEEDHWAYSFVEAAISGKVMAGKNINEDGSILFGSFDKLTREQVAQILYNVEKAEKGEIVVTAENPFTDVVEGQYYVDAVAWAYENGIVSGYPDGTFGVGKDIERREFAMMLYNYAKYKLYKTTQEADMSQFVDAADADWALKYMTWAVGAGVMSGQKGGILNPLGNADRATAATMMVNFLKSYGATHEDNYLSDSEDLKELLVETFMDWGKWENYPESTREGIKQFYPTNLVDCFTISAEWSDTSFYTNGATASALDISKMTVEDIQEYVPDYKEGDKLVVVATGVPTAEKGSSAGGDRNAILKVVLVDEVKELTGIDLSSVDKDVEGVGYTREEAELLVDYYMNHFGYTNERHNINSFAGMIITGPEYISLFDAKTGEELDTQYYAVGREDYGLVWGDFGWRGGVEPANRVDRFTSTIAYLDGETPSAVFGRGYYARTAFEAWNVVNGKLVFLDKIDSGPQYMANPFNWNDEYEVLEQTYGTDPEAGKMSGQGQHYLTAVDANLDGRQEIINGGAIVGYDMDTKQLYVYNAGGDYIGGDENNIWKKHYHGDMMHVTDIDPDYPGVEIASGFEGGKGPYDWAVRTLYTNNTLFGAFTGTDYARFVIGDDLADVRGIEIGTNGSGGSFTASGEPITLGKVSTNHTLRWAANMTTQYLTRDSSYNGSIIGQNKTYLKTDGYLTGNTNAALTADILGDYRDELIIRSADSTNMRIYFNTEVSDRKNYTPMQNLQYRAHVASQQTSYNMPAYTDYYFAADTDWEYVTIPNRKADQAPGEVVQAETADNVAILALSGAWAVNEAETADDVASLVLLDALPTNETENAAAYDAEKWESLEDAMGKLRAKMAFMADDSTPLDYDILVVSKLMAVRAAVEAVMDVPLVNVTEGDNVYAQAVSELAREDVVYAEYTVAALEEAMAAYDEVKTKLDVVAELNELQERIQHWLGGVDTNVSVGYSKYFDFGPVGAEVQEDWIGITREQTYVYSEEVGYGWTTLPLQDWKENGLNDTVPEYLTYAAYDYVRGANEWEFVVDVPNGTYEVIIYASYPGSTKNVSYVIENAEPVSASWVDLGSVAVEVTVTDGQLSVKNGNAKNATEIRGLVIEANAPATVEQYDIARLEQLIADVDMDNRVEADYTVSSWEEFKAAYDAAVALKDNATISVQDGERVYNALNDAKDKLVLRGGIVSYNIDFGPREDSVNGEPQLEVNGQSAGEFESEAVEGAVRPAFQLGYGDMLYADNVSDNGLHWGFDKEVLAGNTTNGGAYFRDWVYAGDSGNDAYTFKADLPTGDYFVFVYTGVKEGETNTTKLSFGNEVIKTTNEVSEEKDGRTVYVQQKDAGGQYPAANSMYYVRVEENTDALSTLPGVKVGTLSITVFDDSNASTRTGVLNGLEIFPVRLD